MQVPAQVQPSRVQERFGAIYVRGRSWAGEFRFSASAQLLGWKFATAARASEWSGDRNGLRWRFDGGGADLRSMVGAALFWGACVCSDGAIRRPTVEGDSGSRFWSEFECREIRICRLSTLPLFYWYVQVTILGSRVSPTLGAPAPNWEALSDGSTCSQSRSPLGWGHLFPAKMTLLATENFAGCG
jgi:hypothetical protein